MALPKAPEKGKPLEEQKVKGASRTPPKGYPEKKKSYADPKNYKYPLDTPEHIRAAIGYFGKSKNYGMYSEGERKSIARRVVSAANKADVEVSDEWKEKHGLKKSDDIDIDILLKAKKGKVPFKRDNDDKPQWLEEKINKKKKKDDEDEDDEDEEENKKKKNPDGKKKKSGACPSHK